MTFYSEDSLLHPASAMPQPSALAGQPRGSGPDAVSLSAAQRKLRDSSFHLLF